MPTDTIDKSTEFQWSPSWRSTIIRYPNGDVRYARIVRRGSRFIAYGIVRYKSGGYTKRWLRRTDSLHRARMASEKWLRGEP